MELTPREQSGSIQLTEAEQFKLLTAYNGEIKLVLGAAMSAESAGEWDTPRMAQTMTTLQGSEPVWEPKHSSLGDYVGRSFVRAGTVQRVPPEDAQGPRPAYRVNPEWSDKTLAFCGALMDWSLEEGLDDTSLTVLLGGSQGAQQGPAVRYRIFDQLLDHPGMSHKQIAEALNATGPEVKNTHHYIKRLGELGILTIDSTQTGYNPTIAIGPEIIEKATNPTNRHQSPLQRLIIGALHDTFESASGQTAAIDLESLAQLCHERDPSTDLHVIRRKIIMIQADSKSPGWEIVRDKTNYARYQKAGVSISPDYEAPLIGLRDYIEGLGDPTMCARYREAARAILANPYLVNCLIEKSLQSSPHTSERRGEGPLQDEILAAVEKLGIATVKNVVVELRDRGYTAASVTVRDRLKEMSNTGLLTVDERVQSVSTTRKVAHYSPGFPLAERFNLLSNLGNHEAKLILGALMSLEPDENLSLSALTTAFNALQGPTPVWNLTPGAFSTYLQKSLIPAGLVDETIPTLAKGSRRTYKPAAEWTNGMNRMLAFCGSLLEWSLNPSHDNLSVIPLLGRTGKFSPHQSPEIRYKMYHHLLQNPGAAPKDIYTALELPSYNIRSAQQQIRNLGEIGIIAVTSRVESYNPQLQISADIARYSQMKSQGLTGTLYQALQRLYDRANEPVATVTREQVLATCQEIDPQADVHALRMTFNNQGGRRYSSGWKIVREADYDEDKLVSASIHPDHEAAISDFCERFASLSDPEAREHYKEVARRILADPDAITQIMAKALRFAPHAAEVRGDTPLRKAIFDVVAEFSELTIRGIMAELRQKGIQADKTTVTDHLNDLAQDGLLNAEMKTRPSGIQRGSLHVSLPKKPGDEA